MSPVRKSASKKRVRLGLRRLFGALPRGLRFWLYRRMVSVQVQPDAELEFKIAETAQELEACFRLLHDAYVGAGFMKPDPSGMRITIYHALPTTTTLCAKYRGEVVGTISIIREGVFGFPMQAIFDLEPVRARGGQIAEISALAVSPAFRKTGGEVLFPLMKYMREYCERYFDTRHLVIAVNPDRIEMYEALLTFDRLVERQVDHYDFANGAPAVGASFDQQSAPGRFRRLFGGRPAGRNLHRYFYDLKLPQFSWPQRRYHTTNDPVMTPALLDHFFNRLSPVLSGLDDRKKALLWTIYDQPDYKPMLPTLSPSGDADGGHPLRNCRRFSMRCPAQIEYADEAGKGVYVVAVIDISHSGFQAESRLPLPLDREGEAVVELGEGKRSVLRARAVRRKDTQGGAFYGFRFEESDAPWRECISAFEMGYTYRDIR